MDDRLKVQIGEVCFKKNGEWIDINESRCIHNNINLGYNQRFSYVDEKLETIERKIVDEQATWEYDESSHIKHVTKTVKTLVEVRGKVVKKGSKQIVLEKEAELNKKNLDNYIEIRNRCSIDVPLPKKTRTVYGAGVLLGLNGLLLLTLCILYYLNTIKLIIINNSICLIGILALFGLFFINLVIYFILNTRLFDKYLGTNFGIGKFSDASAYKLAKIQNNQVICDKFEKGNFTLLSNEETYLLNYCRQHYGNSKKFLSKTKLASKFTCFISLILFGISIFLLYKVTTINENTPVFWTPVTTIGPIVGMAIILSFMIKTFFISLIGLFKNPIYIYVEYFTSERKQYKNSNEYEETKKLIEEINSYTL